VVRVLRSTLADPGELSGYGRAVPDALRVRRRTALAGALGSVAATVLASGCDHGDDIGTQPTGPASDGASSSPPSSPSSSPSESEPDRTPDEELVDATIAQLTAAVGVLVTARRLKPLRPTLAPLVRAHRRHVEVLDGDLEGWTAPVLADAATALQAVHRSEKQLQAALVDAAGRAESGALAKLLASMSASVTQFVATLPTEVAR
jgi:hypothetical protein